MADRYFNSENLVAGNRLERWEFVRAWRRIYQMDRYWVPPHVPSLRRALAAMDPHSARLAPLPLHRAAMRLRGRTRARQGAPLAATPATPATALPAPVAAGVLLRDPRRRDDALYLAHLHCINNRDVLARYLEHVAEIGEAWSILGPVGVSPYLHCGVQTDQWDIVPPLYTAYAPPYLNALLEKVMRPHVAAQTWQIVASRETGAVADSAESRAAVTPFDPTRLAGDLLPLLQHACEPWQRYFPAPDADEAAFLLDWMRTWPLDARAVVVDGATVGFILLQPEMALALRAGNGGYRWWGRAYLAAAARRPQAAGRIVFGAVLPAYRGRGFGRMLLATALASAQQHNWSTLTAGPLPAGAPAARWLANVGAHSQHTFQLYQWSL